MNVRTLKLRFVTIALQSRVGSLVDNLELELTLCSIELPRFKATVSGPCA